MPVEFSRAGNRGTALYRLGERETGTARLEEAVAAHDEALKEYTRDRVPLQWAMSTANQGIILMLLDDKTGDVTKVELAVQQIEIAVVTMRDGANAPAAAYYETQLPKVRSLFNRLSRRSQWFDISGWGIAEIKSFAPNRDPETPDPL